MSTRKTKTRLMLVVLLVAMVAAGFLVLGRNRTVVPQYETAKVEQGAIVAKVTATGSLSALVTVEVGSQVSGRLAELLVDYNSPVKKGQVLARIDPQFFQAALEQSRANYQASQANLTKAQVQAEEARRNFERAKSLRERNLIAQADLDAAQATYDAMRAEIDAAQAALSVARATLHQAELNLSYTTIVSPVDGIVISRAVSVGQTVAASLQAPTLFTIAEDLRRMQVDTSVAESDVGRLAPGLKATFTVDAYPTEEFVGTIRQVRNSPQTVQNVVTYDAVINVDNPDLRLKPGMTANCTFVYAERANAVRIPNAALRFKPAAPLVTADVDTSDVAVASPAVSPPAAVATADSRTIWVLRNGYPQAVTIRIGITDGSWTEVTAGELRPGDEVITGQASGEAAGGNGKSSAKRNSAPPPPMF